MDLENGKGKQSSEALFSLNADHGSKNVDDSWGKCRCWFWSRSKEAQNSAFGDAYLKLVKPYCRVVQTEVNELNLETSNTPFLEILNPVNALEEFLSGEDFHEDNLKGLGDKRRTERDLSKFIIVRYMGASHSEAAPMAVLQSSSLYSGMMYQMDFGFENGEFTCTVAIEGHKTATASSDQKQKVRTLAAEKSLEYLSQTCWTLLIKRQRKKSENMTREIVELEIEKHEKLRRESFDQSGQIQEKEMTFMNRKNLPIRPPGFKIHFEEAVQKTLNEHMISKRDIAFYDFERHEMKKIRKITKVYDNVLVKEMIADNKNCLVVSQVVLGEDSNMKGIGVSGDYFLEYPKIAPVHQFQGNCRPNNAQEGLKTASIQNKKEDTRDESECTLYSVKQEIGTSACSVNHCTIKQENSVRDKFACPHTISVGQVSQATVKEEQTMKKEQPSQYHVDEDYNHFLLKKILD
ncbi:unnamed protein product [Mytilus edulis]|uniref:DRBM domain-containing protein n=1 Tax=Mytilus edulis TaxID=6550 RepID=A0A8S3QPX3_MYTED|nr:unnamed protein product [Mytilus edulis]